MVGHQTDAAWFDALFSNPPSVVDDVVNVLLKYVENVLSNPSDAKYRLIRVTNDVFSRRVQPVRGAVECLQAMGFEKDSASFVLPQSANLERVRTVNGILQTRQRPQPIQRVFNEKDKEEFYSRLMSGIEHVLCYSDRQLREQALRTIPVEQLRRESATMRQNIVSQASDAKEEDCISEQECFLLTLLHWFKSDFFRWCDKPECETCDSAPAQMRSVGMGEPTATERFWRAGRVEMYSCTVCGSMARFPRYNHPGKLLETRRGRCGEWANCFTLCCLSLGFEARHVVDWTDHVWTEVFSERQQRWLHCDPCEDVCDKPLLYEAGWGKKLTYCIAFSCDEVVDVTWRYTAKADEVRTRRTEVSEDWLMHIVRRLNTRQQSGLTAERRSVLEKRAIVEGVEFLSVKTADDDVKGQGRTSGSLQWRLARGETGQAAAAASSSQKTVEVEPYLFEPDDKEVTSLRLRMRYTASGNAYFRQHADAVESGNEPCLRGWRSGMFQCENICHKVENDWRMAYLARDHGDISGSLSWAFEVSSSGLEVDCATFCLEGTTFGSGSIVWTVCGDNGESMTFHTSTSGRMEVPELKGSTMVIVSAELGGGDPVDIAWQHAQICRQPLKDVRQFPIDIDLRLKQAGP